MLCRRNFLNELYAPVDREQKDMELTENEVYAATPRIPVESNKC